MNSGILRRIRQPGLLKIILILLLLLIPDLLLADELKKKQDELERIKQAGKDDDEFFRKKYGIDSMSPEERKFREQESVKVETESAFLKMIDLWSSEKYDQLWEYGTDVDKSTYSVERFDVLMKKSPRRLDSGWSKVKDVSITVTYPTLVYIKATIQFVKVNSFGTREFMNPSSSVTKQFQMIKENGEWKTHLSNFLH